MSDRRFPLISLLCVLLGLLGCAGGGSNPVSVPTSSPEIALQQTVRNWEAVPGVALALVPLVAQTASGTGSTSVASETNLGTITFRELSGRSWEFIVRSVTYTSQDQAEILTAYYGGKTTSQIELVFVMVRSKDGWILDNFKVTQLPQVIVISPGVLRGVVTDEATGKPIPGALVALVGTTLTTMTDQNGAYEFSSLAPGTYTLVVNRDGFLIKTITGVVVN